MWSYDIDYVRVTYAGCDTDENLILLRNETVKLLANIDLGVYHSDCPDIQDSWFTAINDGVCGSFFEGVRTCWLIALISTLLTYILQVPTLILSRSLHGNKAIWPTDNQYSSPTHTPSEMPEQNSAQRQKPTLQSTDKVLDQQL